MKNIFLIALFLMTIIKLSGQSQGITYQAILIDENAKEIPGVDVEGNYLPNQAVTLRFSILNENGAIDYQEEHQTTTDQYGMINLMIGWGIVTSESPGTFMDIDWNGIPKDLRVEISLGELGTSFAEFSLEPLTFVPYAYHRNITATGTMIIEGTTDLNSALNVNNSSPTYLSGSLSTDGIANFNNSSFFQDVTVDGISSLNGQVTINADVNGTDGNFNSYPLRVQGSNQGIAVLVDGTRNSSKNFITFFDGNNNAQGRIEGQTSSELHNSFDYIWDQTYEALMTSYQVAMVIADIAGVDDADAAIVQGAEMVTAIAHIAKKNVQRENTIGVAFQSGGADYAEWLRKANSKEKFSYGDIVGVKGGMIAKDMKNADHYMVVSKNPIVLGNMPPDGEENSYEKVAFMGQVKVKVHGEVRIGDYILASGLNDGFGIAVGPEKIRVEQYSKVVGVAWSASAKNNSFSMVNVAVGTNTNLMATKLKQQQDEIKSVKNQLNTIISYLNSKDPDFEIADFNISQEIAEDNNEESTITDNNEFDTDVSKKRIVSELLKSNPEVLNNILTEAKKTLDKKGVDYNLFEQTSELVNNPDYLLQILESY